MGREVEGQLGQGARKRPLSSNAKVLEEWEKKFRERLRRGDVEFLKFNDLSALFKDRYGVELGSLPGGRQVKTIRDVANVLKHRRGFERADDTKPLRLRINRTYQLVSWTEAFVAAVRDHSRSRPPAG